MIYGDKVARKEFKGKNHKDAYMKAIKWYASYIMSNKNTSDCLVQYVKVQNDVIVATVYACLSKNEIDKKHCEICKQMHNSFFISQETNCAWCNTKAYMNRITDRLHNKLNFVKNEMNKRLRIKNEK